MQSTLRAFHEEAVNKFLTVFVVISAPLLVMSWLRIGESGITWEMLLHTVLLTGSLAVWRWRKRFEPAFKYGWVTLTLVFLGLGAALAHDAVFLGMVHFLLATVIGSLYFRKALIVALVAAESALVFAYSLNQTTRIMHAAMQALALPLYSFVVVWWTRHLLESALFYAEKTDTLNRELETKVLTRTEELQHTAADLETAVTALDDAKRFSESMLDTMGGILVVLDREGRIVRFNQAAERITGFHFEELRDRPIWDYLIPAGVKPVVREVFDKLLLDDLIGRFENELLTRDDGTRLFRWNNSVLRNEQGRVTHVVSIGDDITELRRTEQELEHHRTNLEREVDERTKELGETLLRLQRAHEDAEAANRAKGEFLATMSHEIRTPLGAVIGLLQLLATSALDAQQAEHVRKAEAASKVLMGLLNDILDYSKIEAGALTLENAPFSLSEVLQGLVGVLYKSAESKGLMLHWSISKDCPDNLKGDTMRLSQVLLNLAGNAIKFTDQGRVDIEVMVAPGEDAKRIAQHPSDALVRLRFEVRDTGIGISKEQQQGLFERFTQADSGNTRRFGGTGLGLSISRRLVELMGGAIGLDSDLGRGSLFWFEIPLGCGASPRRSPPAPAPTDASKHALPTLAGMRFLVVEDNPLNQEVIEATLTRSGAAVQLAGDGGEAVEAIRVAEPAYDLVLMDVQMPVLDGIETTRLLRQIYGVSDLPIVALTADAQQATQQACLAAGMDDFLIKPFSLADLAPLVARLCKREAPAQASIPPPATSSPIIEPGFDVEGAVQRLGGHQAIYIRLSRRFVDEQRPKLASLRAELLDASPDGRKRGAKALHKLRGSLLTLGGEQLAEELKTIEAQLLSGEPVDQQALADQVIAYIEQGLAGLGRIADALESGTGSHQTST